MPDECPFVETTHEGTSYCGLAENSVRRLTEEADMLRRRAIEVNEALGETVEHLEVAREQAAHLADAVAGLVCLLPPGGNSVEAAVAALNDWRTSVG
jgi:hypothetical protein